MPIDADAVFIVVPAYNEAGMIGAVVASLRGAWPNVIVVDDGSSDDSAGEAKRNGALVVRHLINRGQGAALQTGIELALRRDAKVIVTFDADGQHRLEDIVALIAALDTHDADVAIGSRFLGDATGIPILRRATLRLAVRFMRFTSGVPLTDAHNGLRAFRSGAARQIRITLDRMAHASEIVDQIREHRLRVTEVPVVIHYSDYSLRKGQSSLSAFRVAFDYLIYRWFR